MTISQQDRRQQLSASAGQTLFTGTFWLPSESILKVYQRSSGSVANDITDILVLNVDYTVNIIDKDSFTITLTTGATLNDIITLDGTIEDYDRTSNITGAEISGSALDAEYDAIIRYAQDTRILLDERVPRYQSSATIASKDLLLPILSAGEIFQMNSLGTGIFGATIDESAGWSTLRSELASEVEDADGASILGYYDAGLGSGTTVHDKLDSSTCPVLDTTAIVRNATDETRKVKLNSQYLSTGVTRTIYMRDEDVDFRNDIAPITDSVDLLKSSSDNTKRLKFDLSPLTTSTQRTWTMKDTDINFNAQVAPILVTTAIARDNADEDKQIFFNINQYSAATTRTITWPDRDLLMTPKIVRANRNSTVSIGSTLTEIAFDNLVIDIGGDFNTGNGRYTPQVAGYYRVSAAIGFTSTSDDNYLRCWIYKNGSQYGLPGTYATVNTSGGSGLLMTASISDIIECNGSTDYISLFASSADTLNLNVNSFIAIERILD